MMNLYSHKGNLYKYKYIFTSTSASPAHKAGCEDWNHKSIDDQVTKGTHQLEYVEMLDR